MENGFSVEQIKNLQKLLSVPKNDSDSDDDIPQHNLKGKP